MIGRHGIPRHLGSCASSASGDSSEIQSCTYTYHFNSTDLDGCSWWECMGILLSILRFSMLDKNHDTVLRCINIPVYIYILYVI